MKTFQVRNDCRAFVTTPSLVTDVNGIMLELTGNPFISFAVDESAMVMAIDLVNLIVYIGETLKPVKNFYQYKVFFKKSPKSTPII